MSHTLPLAPSPAACLAAALGRALPVLPVVAVIATLALPVLPSTEGGATAADGVSGLVVVCCAVRLLRYRRRPLSPTAAVVLGLPVLGVAVAAAGAGSTGAAASGMVRYLQVFVLVPLAVLLLVRGRRDFRLLAWSFVGLALWQGAIGVRQYLTGTGASYMGEDIRAVGTFGATDVMGMSTVVSLGLVCAAGLALGDGPARRRTAAGACALVLCVPLALSFSRGAWIATVLTCAAQLLLAGPRRAVRVGAAVTAAAVILVGGVGAGSAMLQERMTSITRVTGTPDQSVVDRYTMWAAAVDMWRAEPLTGVGLKGFPDHRDGHASLALSSGSDVEGAGAQYRRQPLLSPHNMYLLVLGEQGLVGLVALAGSWLALLVCALRGLARVRRTPSGLDCALVACGLLVWQLTDFVYADIGGPSTVLTAVCLGLVGWWALMDGTSGTSPATSASARPGPDAGPVPGAGSSSDVSPPPGAAPAPEGPEPSSAPRSPGTPEEASAR
ncbi:O-antigen ligase family protein [Streptomyces sp. NPDC008313]|uniref:O-antigen ligase family protein n=1 Tax=Streptomyces sp. NPDC008313 TaxID=3364826 RepID=UPI0036E498A9